VRRLIYVPIIHTEADMGSLKELLKQKYIEQVGEKAWEEHKKTVEETWQDIEKGLEALGLPYSRVKLYQDGLPCCGREPELVKELAAEGNPNYQLLLKLMEKGAEVVGTEDPALLLEEYRSLLHPPQAERKSALGGQVRLKKRDTFIAQRIHHSLKEGEIGILFLGLLHRVDKELPSDIQVEFFLEHLGQRA
jgi:hypothetical protein